MEMSKLDQQTTVAPLVARPAPLYGAALARAPVSPSSLADLVDRNNCICLRQADLDEAGDETSCLRGAPAGPQPQGACVLVGTAPAAATCG